jgi:hypothetical protein
LLAEKAFPTILWLALMLAVSAVLSGCGGAERNPLPPRRAPSEGETRDAYFNTPVIYAGMALPGLGSTRRALFARLGVATISYRPAGAPSLECVIYPIGDTERWDRFGSPEADEWQLCLDRRGRLVTKRRLSPPRLDQKPP